MYQRRAIHPISRTLEPLSQATVETLWTIFVAIGERWTLGDDPSTYRLRFETFLENRINVSPIYRDYYAKGAVYFDELVSDLGQAAALDRLFGQKPRVVQSGIPATRLEAIQRFVANEFISLRLALGGFKSFGAINYRGYFGGANIEGEPTPYRKR
ncbi:MULTISPECIES: hypothetical protein [unclassified Rhizobium]|uniref:hypothetical protein n=1 Tax=unclassified Rhizobium TaxID=2613769 RepID=UPI001A97D4D0|nr:MULTISPECIES: hypothetical protein [unclassified Rhizobium]MBX5164531.1 hypothetical protein [Rhizobium sp. NZLR4b]MBX5190847.1 hypothetical protein [Rhizobium sp. NZLR3b]MBX5204462.1 hypothetical protein [Rhizobium sp. NZLR1]QSZ24682.1 hypothetical protein J3O30_30505 [Rhizobium sp. NZLR1]